MDSRRARIFTAPRATAEPRGPQCHNESQFGIPCTMRDNYGGGHASGRVVRDTVNVAGLAATNPTFGVIDHLDLEGSTLKAWEGILGLQPHLGGTSGQWL